METCLNQEQNRRKKVVGPQRDSLVIFKCDKGLGKSAWALPTAGATASILAPHSTSCSPSHFCTITPDTLLMKYLLKSRTTGFQHLVVLQWEAFCLSTGYFHCNLGKHNPITNTEAIPLSHC